jgi:uncharacterized membrane protein HdeD (DUF308 family)
MSNIISQTVSTIKNWWLFLLTGSLMIIGSIWVFTTPQESYVALAWLFSILVLANGISYVFFSLSNTKDLKGWGWYLAGGIFEIIVGIVLLSYPEISLVTLPLVVAFWLMFRGIQLIGASLDLKEYGFMDWGWFMLLGVALTVFSFLMFLFPLFGAFNVVYLTSLALMVFGIANIMLSLKLKKIKSMTIDKVADLKKDIKKGLKELKEEIMKNLKEDVSAEQKEEIARAFDEYENKSV